MDKSLFHCLVCAFLIACVYSLQPNSRGICHYDNLKFTNDKFQCSDGSKWISIEEFNDDYCDCPDHSDEPGTSACNSTFCCLNSEHRHSLLSSKYVDDGVCDCCDGSDEKMINCPNTCKDLKAKETEILDKRLSILKEANNVKKESINESLTILSEMESSISEKKQKLVELLSEMEKTNSLLDTLKLRMNTAIDHFKRTKELLLAKELIKDTMNEINTLNEHFKKLQNDEDIELFYKNYNNIKSKNQPADFVNFLKSLNRILEKPHDLDQPNIQESPKEEHVDSAIDSKKGDDLPLENHEDSHHEHDENSQHGDEEFHENTFLEENKNKMKPQEDQYDEQTSALIDEYKKVEEQIHVQKFEIKQIEDSVSLYDTLKLIDFGESNMYYSLYDKCFSMNHDGYEYELCFFKSLTQKGGRHAVSLGKWKQWDINNDKKTKIMIFEDGDSCWNGTKRSSKVILKCGRETKLVSASEPSMCQYEIVVTTPLDCQLIPVAIDHSFIDYVMGHDEL